MELFTSAYQFLAGQMGGRIAASTAPTAGYTLTLPLVPDVENESLLERGAVLCAIADAS